MKYHLPPPPNARAGHLTRKAAKCLGATRRGCTGEQARLTCPVAALVGMVLLGAQRARLSCGRCEDEDAPCELRLAELVAARAASSTAGCGAGLASPSAGCCARAASPAA